MGAFDVLYRRGKGDHFLDTPPRIGAGEVLPHPSMQIGRGADVEDLRARPAKEVHPGPVRKSLGQHPLGALGVGRSGQIRAQIPVCRHTLIAHPCDQGVQHVDGGASVIQCAVRGLGGRPDQTRQRGQPHAGCLCPAQHPTCQPHRAQHRETRPVDIALLGCGLQESDIESCVVCHQDGATGELQEHRQHRRDRRSIAHHRGGDPGEFDDLRRDISLRVHQRGEFTDDLPAAHLDRTDLGDRVTGSVRGRPSPRSGGLQVDDDEGRVMQRGFGDGIDVGKAQLEVCWRAGHGDRR